MKKLTVIATIIFLALAIVAPLSAYSASAPVIGGRVVVSAGPIPTFSGEVQELSNGEIAGNWQWTLGQYCGYTVKFDSIEVSGLTFTGKNKATFTASFQSNDLPLDFMSHEATRCHFRFVVTETEVPPGVALPNMALDMMEVYCDDVLIAVQYGDFEVNAY